MTRGHVALDPGPATDDLTLTILRALASGQQVSEAARSCNVSEATVRRRVRDLKTKWDAVNTTAVIVRAVRMGLI